MKIIRSAFYLKQLQKILKFIALDNPYNALGFEKELNAKFKMVITNPLMCRQSNYFGNKDFRDLIYKGYTFIYKIEQQQLILLDVFKWQNKG